MDAFISSFLLVCIGEMGDKTQLLALLLTARYRKPWTILAGVFVSTLLNHGLASWLGGWVASHLDPNVLRVGLGLLFFAFAAWVLVPDKEEGPSQTGHFGAFLTTAIAFFMAEMGDKTQLATIALGARFASVWVVTIGTTLGMMVSNALAIFLGDRLLRRISMTWVRRVACAMFAIFGVCVLWKF